MIGRRSIRIELRRALLPLLAFLCIAMLIGQFGERAHAPGFGAGTGASCDAARHDGGDGPPTGDHASCCVMCASASSERLLLVALVVSALVVEARKPVETFSTAGSRELPPLRPPIGWASSWSAQAPPVFL